MTVEERVQALETELAALKQKKPAYTLAGYRAATNKCSAYFARVRLPGQDYGGRMRCEELARKVFKEKHKITGDASASPARYIRTEQDIMEYFEIFKRFLTVYQEICSTPEERSPP